MADNNATAEYLGGTKIRLTWDGCGHSRTLDYKPRPASAVRAVYLGMRNGADAGPCGTCAKAERKRKAAAKRKAKAKKAASDD